jgi:hypothetical protein
MKLRLLVAATGLVAVASGCEGPAHVAPDPAATRHIPTTTTTTDTTNTSDRGGTGMGADN